MRKQMIQKADTIKNFYRGKRNLFLKNLCSIMRKSKYLESNRLEDIISLLSLLSLSEYAFLDNAALQEALRSEPTSSVSNQSWLDIGVEHPEFFRSNGSRDHLGLVLRPYKPVMQHPKIGDYREPMSVGEAQELINKAMALYDKAVVNSKRWDLMWPSLIAAAALFLTNYFTIYHKDSELKDTLKQIQISLDSINYEVRLAKQLTRKTATTTLSDSNSTATPHPAQHPASFPALALPATAPRRSSGTSPPR